MRTNRQITKQRKQNYPSQLLRLFANRFSLDDSSIGGPVKWQHDKYIVGRPQSQNRNCETKLCQQGIAIHSGRSTVRNSRQPYIEQYDDNLAR